MKINIVVVEFLRYQRIVERKSDASIQAYQCALKKYLHFLNQQGVTVLEEITPTVIQFYFQEFNGAKSSMNQAVSVLRSFHAFLHLEYKIANPTLVLHSYKQTKVLPKIISENEMKSILEGIDPTDFLRIAIFELLYGCGLRVSEICSLRYSDVYLEQKFIKFTAKGNKQRMLPISNAVKKSLQDYFQFQRVDQVGVNSIPCFLNAKGLHVTRHQIHSMVKYEIQKQGLSPNISAHTFRHAFATHLLDGGADLRIVQELLGHENIGTTQIYTHVQTKKMRVAYDNFHPRNKENDDEI